MMTQHPLKKTVKSCPFCNGSHIHHESSTNVRYLRCQDCSATGGYTFDIKGGGTREDAERLWNVRKYPGIGWSPDDWDREKKNIARNHGFNFLLVNDLIDMIKVHILSMLCDEEYSTGYEKERKGEENE